MNSSIRLWLVFVTALGIVGLAGAHDAWASGTGTITIPIRWCAVDGTNAVLNPGCVGESSTKDVLWRRHERPTDTMYTPHCNVTWRSGAIAAQPTFPVIADPCDPTITPACPGVRGDIFVDPAAMNYTEYYDAIIACAAAWNTTGVGAIGVVGVNIRRFVNAAGTPIAILGLGGLPMFCDTASQMGTAGGFAAIDNDFTRGSATPPCLAEVVNDPNDQLTGHEFGHALSLPHLSGTIMGPTIPPLSTLLTSGGPGQTDIVCPSPVPMPTSQCGQVRLQAMCHIPGVDVDPPPIVDQLPLATGTTSLPYVDLGMVGLVSDSNFDEASFFWEAAGLFPDSDAVEDVVYAFAADLDLDPMTGGSPGAVGVPITLGGSDLVGRVVVDMELVQGAKVFTATPTLWRFESGSFAVQQTLGAQAGEARVGLIQLSPATFPDDAPFFTFASIRFDRSLLLAEGQVSFGDVDFGVTARESGGEHDTPAVARFYMNTPSLPTCQTKPQTTIVGETVQVTASGLAQNQTTHVVLGASVVANGSTDGNGDTSSTFTIPPDTPLGLHIVTIGVDDPMDAVTADCTLGIVRVEAVPSLTWWSGLIFVILMVITGTILLISRRRPA